MTKITISLLMLILTNVNASEICEYFSKEKENVKLETIKIIISKEKKIDGDENDYGTPIAWATYYNKPSIVKYFISIGSDINKQASFKGKPIQEQIKMIGTPLHVACIKGYYKIAKMLLEAGANPYITNPYRADSFQLAESKDLKALLIKYKTKGKLSSTDKKKLIEKELKDPIKYKFDFKYYIDLKTATQKAIQTNKPIILVIMSNSCRACNRYAKTTLSDKDVASSLKNNFIVVMLKSSNNISAKYKTQGTPTTWFLDKNGEAILNPVLGPISKNRFLKALNMCVK